MNTNVILVWDRMGDYHRARWQALQREMPDVKVYGADLCGSDQLYGWQNTDDNSLYFQLSRKPASRFDLGRIFKFIRIVRQYKIGAVCIAGYGRPEYIFFLIYARLTGRRVTLFAESWYASSAIVDKIKSLFLRVTCDGFLVSGIHARNHFLKRLEINEGKIRIGYSVVDNDHFKPHQNNLSPNQNNCLLCVARFSPEKNLEFLIDSFLASDMPGLGWELVLVGGGPLKNVLASKAAGNPIKLINWVSYQELPTLYHSASVFILPSLFEPWGLVVNEAMAAGLPILVSENVGCLPDLIIEDVNGWKFNADHTEQLTSILNSLSQITSTELSLRGHKSQEMISKFSLSRFSSGLKELLLPR